MKVGEISDVAVVVMAVRLRYLIQQRGECAETIDKRQVEFIDELAESSAAVVVQREYPILIVGEVRCVGPRL